MFDTRKSKHQGLGFFWIGLGHEVLIGECIPGCRSPFHAVKPLDSAVFGAVECF